jgi:arylsulfatase A-like enzyme
VLGSAGYATAYIGKWHLDGQGRSSYIPPERRQGWSYWKAAECDHNYNRSHYYTGNSDVKCFWEGYDAFAQTKDAQQYIRDRAGGKQPFILFVAYGTPHFPHGTAPPEFKALYPTDKIQLPPNVAPELRQKALTEAQGYYAHCTALDRCVGDLLHTLAETGMGTNTVFIFTSDHGEMMGSHGIPPFTKQVAWSEAAQVPFLLCFPMLHGAQGHEVQTPLTTPDILPTLLGLAGVEVPRTVEGEDLSASLRVGQYAEDRAALYMGVAPFVAPKFAWEYRAIHTSRYTYARSLEGPWMLFDDQTDPYQTNNLVGNPAQTALIRQMEDRLQGQLKRIGDDFRPADWYIKEWGYTIGAHGSVPYDKPDAKPQTPRRRLQGR